MVHLSCSCGLIILVSLGIALPAQSGWAVLWIIASMLILLGAWQHRRAAAQQPTLELPTAAANQHHQHTTNDVESVARLAVGQQQHGMLLTTKAGQPQPELQQPNCASRFDSKGSCKQQRCSAQACSCSKAGWRRCCTGCGSCLAWSSLFWGAVLGLFLVIQAAHLAHDMMAFPPPGQLVEVGLDNGKCTSVILAAISGHTCCRPLAERLQLLAAKASMLLHAVAACVCVRC